LKINITAEMINALGDDYDEPSSFVTAEEHAKLTRLLQRRIKENEAEAARNAKQPVATAASSRKRPSR